MSNPHSPAILLRRSHGQKPPTTPNATLHPEILSVISLNTAHTRKIYFSGPLVQVFDRNAGGHKPHKDQKWRDVWAQLYGTTLAIWDMVEVKIAHQQGREVPPSYANTIDAVRSPFHLHYLRDLIPSPVRQCPRFLDTARDTDVLPSQIP